MNLLVTGAWHEASEYLKDLEACGHRIQMLQWEKDPLPCTYEWVEGTICSRLFSYHPIEQFKNLRYIQLTCAGTDHMPMDYIREHGIQLHNARGVYSIPMAEYAVSGVLQLYKQAGLFAENQKKHKWEKIRDLSELYGKTVCILGCGSVGTECAKRFHAFGCRVIGIRKHAESSILKQVSYFDIVESTDFLNRFLLEADILVAALPLSDETFHLINEERLSLLKKQAIIVNLARGQILDTEALAGALREVTIGGAVLDVFEEEPLLENSPLWDMDNVILTPHNSYAGEGNAERLCNLILKNISGFTNLSVRRE